MKTYKKSPLPSSLKSVPKGYVYLGKGGEFKTNGKEFHGYGLYAYDDFNRAPQKFPLNGRSTNFYYFAPADSEIARLNGLGPRKRKVAPKVRYFVHVRGFDYDTAYVRHDGDPKENVMCVLKKGGEEPSPTVDIEFCLDACKRGVWKEISHKEAVALVTKPAPVAPPAPIFHKPCGRGGIPIPPVTIGDVWEAFHKYCESPTGDDHAYLKICSDGSGGIEGGLSGRRLFSWSGLSSALREIKSHTK